MKKEQLEKRFTAYLIKTIKGYSSRKQKKYKTQEMQETELNEKEENFVSLREYLEEETNELDVNYREPEKAFSNLSYYKAMKKVPQKQKQALYLLVVEDFTIQEVSKILKVSPNSVTTLKKLAIENFKKNLEELK